MKFLTIEILNIHFARKYLTLNTVTKILKTGSEYCKNSFESIMLDETNLASHNYFQHNTTLY